jgi:hypothetical protein
MASTTISNALELEFGIGYTDNQFYNVTENYTEQYGRRNVGKIALYHKFEITKVVGIKLWGEHYSLFARPEPHFNPYGKNIAGVSLVFKLF